MITQTSNLVSGIQAAMEQGLAAVRSLTDSGTSPRAILPRRDDVGRFIDLERELSRLPEVYSQYMEGSDLQQLLHRHQRIAAKVAGCQPGARRTLSRLAGEVASFRVPVDPDDAFDVSGAGVLTAISLCNFMHLLSQWKENPRAVIEGKQMRRVVWWPLHQSDRTFKQSRPGDLWFMDLCARSVLSACRAVTKSFQQKAATQVFAPLMLEFVTRSSLTKLLEADPLGKQFAGHARYEQWPGLETIVAADDAFSLRAVLAIELVPRLTGDGAGLHQIAFLRFLSHVLGVSAEHIWSARLFLCHLLLELFGNDPQTPIRMLKRGEAAKPLLDVLRFLQNGKIEHASDTEMPSKRQFLDLYKSLEDYDEFQSLKGIANV